MSGKRHHPDYSDLLALLMLAGFLWLCLGIWAATSSPTFQAVTR